MAFLQSFSCNSRQDAFFVRPATWALLDAPAALLSTQTVSSGLAACCRRVLWPAAGGPGFATRLLPLGCASRPPWLQGCFEQLPFQTSHLCSTSMWRGGSSRGPLNAETDDSVASARQACASTAARRARAEARFSFLPPPLRRLGARPWFLQTVTSARRACGEARHPAASPSRQTVPSHLCSTSTWRGAPSV